jgi:hypothetical protein
MASVINGTNIVLYEYDSNAIYFFNGDFGGGVFDGIVCKQMSRTQEVETSSNFTKTGAGTIAAFITDAGEPGVTTIHQELGALVLIILLLLPLQELKLNTNYINIMVVLQPYCSHRK